MGNVVGRDFGAGVTIQPGFVENLHPALKELLDVEKLIKQSENAGPLENADSGVITFQRRRNLQTVKELDHWLKQGPPGSPEQVTPNPWKIH